MSSPVVNLPKPASNPATTHPRVLMVSYLIPPYTFAGAGNQAMLLSRTLIRSGCPVSLVTSGGQKLFERVELETVPVYRLKGSRNKYLNLLLFYLMSILWWMGNAHRFDVLHIHACTHLTTLIWFPLAKLFNKKCLLKITCPGIDDLSAIRHYPGIGPLAFQFAKLGDGFLALTPDIADDTQHNIPDARIYRINNGYDPKLFYPVTNQEKKLLRKNLGLPDSGPLLIYTGGINPRKDPMFLIEGFAKVKAAHPDAHFCLIGPNKSKFKGYGQQVDERIEALGLSNAITLTGEKSYTEIPKYVQAGDIFVFASTQDSLPSSLIEAAACGLHVVVTELQGTTECLFEGIERVDIIPKDVDTFAEKIHQAILGLSQDGQHPGTVRDAVTQRYNMDHIAQDYLTRIYPALLGS